jgi:hypothetical protein
VAERVRVVEDDEEIGVELRLDGAARRGYVGSREL